MNSWQRRKYESWLVPYADGTLEGRRRVELEAALSRDPVLAADAEAQRRVAGRLRGAAEAENAGRKPETSRLWPQVQARIVPSPRARGPWVWAGGACAAACLAWAALWGPMTGTPSVQSRAVPPPAGVKNPAGQVPEANASPPAHQRKRTVPHSIKIKVAGPTVRSYKAIPTPAVPAQRHEWAAAQGGAAHLTPLSAPLLSPKPAAAVGGAARFQPAIGIREGSSRDDNTGATTGNPGADNSDVKMPAFEGNASAADNAPAATAPRRYFACGCRIDSGGCRHACAETLGAASPPRAASWDGFFPEIPCPGPGNYPVGGRYAEADPYTQQARGLSRLI